MPSSANGQVCAVSDVKPSDAKPNAPKRGKWWLRYRTLGGDRPVDSMSPDLLCSIELSADECPPGFVEGLYAVSPLGDWTLFDCIDDALPQEVERIIQLLKEDHATELDFQYVSDEEARRNELGYVRLRRDWKDIQEPSEGEWGLPNLPMWVVILSKEGRKILDVIRHLDEDKDTDAPTEARRITHVTTDAGQDDATDTTDVICQDVPEASNRQVAVRDTVVLEPVELCELWSQTDKVLRWLDRVIAEMHHICWAISEGQSPTVAAGHREELRDALRGLNKSFEQSRVAEAIERARGADLGTERGTMDQLADDLLSLRDAVADLLIEMVHGRRTQCSVLAFSAESVSLGFCSPSW